MTTLALSPQIASHIKSIEGRTNDDKLLRLLETYLASQIRACEQEISHYEVKYRSTFAEFAQAWEQDEIPNKRSHEVERDYMEWEGLVAERQTLCALIEAVDDLGCGIAVLMAELAIANGEDEVERLTALEIEEWLSNGVS